MRTLAPRLLWLFALVALQGVASGRTSHGHARKPAAGLVLSYEVVRESRKLHEVWFLDSQGRQFTFTDARVQGPLQQVAGGGTITPRDVNGLIKVSRPLPGGLSPAEVDRAAALVGRAERSILWTHRRRGACPDGATVIIRGYFFPAGKKDEAPVSLRETACGHPVDENLSPEAQELIDWVYRLSGVPRPHALR